MHLDRDHPANRGILEYFCRNTGEQFPWLEPISDPSAFRPQSGSHPDIVDYLWDTLGSALPVECRALVCGRAVLLAPGRGIIFAVPLGTEYGLRLPPAEFALARSAGAEVVHHYSTVEITLDLAEQFGPHWLFGTFDRREPEWCRAALAFAER
jgi:hypothetical protein